MNNTNYSRGWAFSDRQIEFLIATLERISVVNNGYKHRAAYKMGLINYQVVINKIKKGITNGRY